MQLGTNICFSFNYITRRTKLLFLKDINFNGALDLRSERSLKKIRCIKGWCELELGNGKDFWFHSFSWSMLRDRNATYY